MCTCSMSSNVNLLIFFFLPILNYRQQEISQVIHNLDETWKKFLNCASSSATDFLSIDHLGRILDVLYESGMEKIIF